MAGERCNLVMLEAEMDLRHVEEVVTKEREVGKMEYKDPMIDPDHPHTAKDSGSALQAFLDRIPVSSIPGLRNPPGDFVSDAIQLLHEKNIFGAPILDPVTNTGRFLNRYIGLIDFASMVLWSIEECEKGCVETEGNGSDEKREASFFTILGQNPQIGQTMVGELAKLFLWNPFFPMRLDDTLFHVLLLLSNHRLQVVPVIERPDSQVIGFITQSAVIQLLLQSNGLEWFDNIADKALSEFRCANEEHVSLVYADTSLAETLSALHKTQVGVVAVVDRKTHRLLGCVRKNDVYLVVEIDDIFDKRKSITVEEFIHIEPAAAIKGESGGVLPGNIFRLRNMCLPRMDSPITNKKTDSLKEAMKNLAENNSSFSFLVDDLHRPKSLLTLRDIIIQFAPPCVDSTIHGSGFFASALEQASCTVKNGTVLCDH